MRFSFIGIDPGRSGAAVAIHDDGDFMHELRFNKASWGSLHDWLLDMNEVSIIMSITVERVHSRPGNGVKSSFSFGMSYGAIMEAVGVFSDQIPANRVRPQEWMKYLDCMTGGDKKVTRDFAKELFPNQNIVLANADAFLLAEYGRRVWNGGEVIDSGIDSQARVT